MCEFQSGGPVGKGFGWMILGALFSIWHWNIWYFVASIVIPVAYYWLQDIIEKAYWKSQCDREEIKRP